MKGIAVILWFRRIGAIKTSEESYRGQIAKLAEKMPGQGKERLVWWQPLIRRKKKNHAIASVRSRE